MNFVLSAGNLDSVVTESGVQTADRRASSNSQADESGYADGMSYYQDEVMQQVSTSMPTECLITAG